ERSEGAPSQKIGRELEASNIGPMCKRKPERSEGSGRNPVFLIKFNHFWTPANPAPEVSVTPEVSSPGPGAGVT
ncbi:MAG: hypothetical protein ACLPQX_03490, partial [Syntrophobacteraceae bacterium]